MSPGVFSAQVHAVYLAAPWQGLAHFCEHMLFLGTQKYPDPSAARTIWQRGLRILFSWEWTS